MCSVSQRLNRLGTKIFQDDFSICMWQGTYLWKKFTHLTKLKLKEPFKAYCDLYQFQHLRQLSGRLIPADIVLANFPKLERLDGSCMRLLENNASDAPSTLTRLKAHVIENDAFPHLTCLRQLSMRYSSDKLIEITRLTQLTSLKTGEMVKAPFIAFLQFLPCLTNLTKLHLNDKSLFDPEAVLRLTNLRSLKLFSTIKVEDLTALHQLRSLTLEKDWVMNRSANLVNLSLLTQLRKINFNEWDARPERTQSLTLLTKISNFRGNYPVFPVSLRSLSGRSARPAYISHLTDLTELRLETSISLPSQLQNLTSLIVPQVSRTDIKMMTKLVKLGILEEDDAHLLDLSQYPHLTYLKRLGSIPFFSEHNLIEVLGRGGDESYKDELMPKDNVILGLEPEDDVYELSDYL